MTGRDINAHAYDIVASSYLAEHAEENLWKPEMEDFTDFLRSESDESIVLDLGCGPGQEGVWLASRPGIKKVIGVDISPKMVSLSIATGIETVVSDISTYVHSEKVDGLWARASLHHLSDEELRGSFLSFAHYLKDGGILAMVNKVGNGEEVEDKAKYGTLLRRYFNYFDEEKVDGLCNSYGYDLLWQYRREEGGHEWLISFLEKQS